MDNTPIIEPSSSLAISNGTAATNAAATANPGTTAAAKTAVPPTSNPSSAAIGKTAAATSAKPGGAALAKWNGAMFANPVSWPTAKLYGAQAAKISGEKLVAVGLMIKLLMVLAVIPVGAIVAGIWLAKGRKSEVPVRVNRRKPKRKSLMRRLFAGRVALICLTLITVGMLSIGGFLIYKRVKVYNISIAAGDAKGESFVLMKALQTVAGRYYPHINITVSETGGTTENLRRIERGDAQFATAQADVSAGPTARSVAVLYEDNFQLLAHGKADGAKHEGTPAKGEAAAPLSGIAHFADLKGKKIALPNSGGQYQSFLSVAKHFGLKDADFVFVGGDDEAAEVAFAKEEADAIFRVRALHNNAITQLVHGGNVIFVPLEDASAMRVEAPAYIPTTIPKGTYQGDPPVPPNDLPTIAIQRLLMVRKDVDDDVVHAITQMLMERRQDLAAAIPNADEAVRPLVGHAAQPILRAGIGAGLHPAAMAYYDHDESSFVGKHADLIAITLSLCVLIGLWFSELRRSFGLSQKNHADAYNLKIVDLMKEAQESAPGEDLAPIRTELVNMLALAVQDLESNKLSENSFQLFYAIWQAAIDQVRDREAALSGQRTPSVEGYVVTPADLNSPHASLAKMLHHGASATNT